MADSIREKFPTDADLARLGRYHKNQQLLNSKHYDAFAITGEKDFSEGYNRLRYIVANFDGLVAKTSADLLFGEEIKIEGPNKIQKWIDALVFKNKLNPQLWESANSNAAKGDAILRVRLQKNETGEPNIIIEDSNVATYFPEINKANVREHPRVENIVWYENRIVSGEARVFVIKERHSPGSIDLMIWLTEKAKAGATQHNLETQWTVEAYNNSFGANYVEHVDTKIDDNLIVHIPNYRNDGSSEYWGVSDFIDLETLQFELNNRLTKNANILDKHSDPILAVPPGVLGKDGQVKKEYLSMFEMGAGDNRMPEYVVWNANLEAAFKQIDRMVDFLLMMSETSPALIGLDKNGVAESGRALKMRLIRSISKKNRKQRYYDQGITEAVVLAEKISIAHGIPIMGQSLGDSPELVDIRWQDGIVDDVVEKSERIIKEVDAGLMSETKAIMELQGVSEQEAKREVKEIKKSRADFTSITDTMNPGGSDGGNLNADDTNNDE